MKAINPEALMKMSSAVSANKKLNRNNAGTEFLTLLCEQTAGQMIPKDMVNRDLMIQIYAKELARQIEKQGNISEVNIK